ncbi:glycosyltransferase [Neptunomonas japonica]|uniref:glycosyltransferase n=1 Tax=Neptunomonas japonica TaxID=417574 RepID=UPI00040C8896|nr:glycosyltransferase [Neptunomonas japonica]
MNKVIVQVVQHLRPGGIETMALDLLKQLDSQAEVHIFSLEGDKASAIKQWPRLAETAHRLHFFDKSAGLDLTLVQRLIRRLIHLKASSVHSHHIGPFLYAGMAAKYLKLKHVHTEHDAWHLNKKSNKRLQRTLIYLLKPMLVADCSEVATALNKHFPATTPKIILNGVDTQHFLPPTKQQKASAKARLKIPKQTLLVGCAARLETVKGHKFLLKALSRTHLDVHLVLAGDGSLRSSLEDLAEKLGIAERVTFLGNINDMVPFYHAIDLFCLPSLNEGLPLSPLEAQACGVPVIVTNVGGCKNIVCPKTGITVSAGNIKELQEALLHHSLSSRRTSPRQFVLSKGDLTKTAQAYFQLLEPNLSSQPTLEV